MEALVFIVVVIVMIVIRSIIDALIEHYREAHWKCVEERVDAFSSNTHAQSSSHDDGLSDSEGTNAAGLMFRSLCELGCQPTKNDDGSIIVQYQGENFIMEFGERYVRIWDPQWSAIKADNPELPQVREAVNSANFNFGPTVVMTPPDENGVIEFHSRYDIMLHPACPDNPSYVRATLDYFFMAKEHVVSIFDQLKQDQSEAHKNRRPVGFATEPTDTPD